MSQVSIIDIETNNPQIPTTFVTNSGNAIPIANTLEVLGINGITTSGSGNTITIDGNGLVTDVTLHTDVGGPLIGDDFTLTGTNIYTTGSGSTASFNLQGTNHALFVGRGANTPAVSLAAATNGQLPIGSTGLDPVLATLTGGTGISIANGAGSITINASLTTPLSFPTDSGTGTPAANALSLLGQNVAGSGIQTSASGSTVSHRMLTPYTLGDFTFSNATAGATRLLSVVHSDNTNPNSNARILIQSGGASGGYPILGFNIPGGLGYSWGIDNGDGDSFGLNSDSTFTGVGLCKFVPAIGKVIFGPSINANDNLVVAINQSGDAAAGSGVQIETSGGADAYMNVNLTASRSYCFGIDNSDSDNLKINGLNATGCTPSSGTNLLTITTAGVLTLPQAPLGETSGGTNQSTYTQGDLLYASAANTLSKLAKNTTATRYLSNTGTSNNPAWAQIDVSNGLTGTVPLANGGTSANLTASNGGIFYSTAAAGAILAGTATANKVLMSGSTAAPTWSTPTFPNASATSGKFIISDGTNWIASTPTIPNTAGTSGKILISDGTNFVSSTPTYPNTSATSGKLIQSDGTNFIASTPTWPTAIAQGDILYGSATSTVTALAKNSSSTRYLSNTGTTNNPAWAQVALSTGVSDYSTGSWTPTLSFGGASVGITYTSNIGTYVKIGTSVFVQGRILLSSKGSSTGGALVSGLPFQNNTSTNPQITIGMNAALTLTAGYTVVYGEPVFASSTFAFKQNGSNVGALAMTDTAFANTTDVWFTGFYTT